MCLVFEIFRPKNNFKSAILVLVSICMIHNWSKEKCCGVTKSWLIRSNIKMANTWRMTQNISKPKLSSNEKSLFLPQPFKLVCH